MLHCPLFAYSTYTGISGSGFISFFPVVVADLSGAEILALKVGSLNTVSGLGTLAGPSIEYAIIGSEVDSIRPLELPALESSLSLAG